MRRVLLLCSAPLLLLLAACSAPGTTEESAASEISAQRRWTSPDAAPAYSGEGFARAQIFRVADGVWLDEAELSQALRAADVTFFGEQHETAPVQALERWVETKVLAVHADAALAMEHFQSDEQPIIDQYFAGTIDQATFEAQSQPWPNYATYWRPVVEEARAAGRPLFGLNVPKEVLSGIYAQFPTAPQVAFDAIPTTSSYDGTLPTRPLIAWDASYRNWFETSFDYAAHGAGWGLTYDEALQYFTDLAHIRDETMAHWVVRALQTTPHLYVVAGDWHVQTRLAMPDRVTRLSPSTTTLTVTTAHADRFESVQAVSEPGRPVADYIITYH
jgi:uncharacterized iron-regulated protein